MKTEPGYLEVQLFDAKPNKMFPDWLTQRTQFLRYSSSVQCAACGKKSRHHWTLLTAFQTAHMEDHIAGLTPRATIYPPLTPVCRDHMLAPVAPYKGLKKRTAKTGKNPVRLRGV
jgi:hypothetical protein